MRHLSRVLSIRWRSSSSGEGGAFVRELVCVLAWFSFAALLTHPGWIGSDSVVLGNWSGPDLVGTAWTWWWTAEALGSAEIPWHSQIIFYPFGLYPIAQLNLLDAWMAAPLSWIFGPTRAYNLMVLCMMAGNAWATQRLCRWEGADRLSSIFGAVALATSSYLVMELWTGRLTQFWLLPLIMSLGLWRRLLDGELKRRGQLLAGLFLASTFIGYWYYGFFAVLAIGCMAVGRIRVLSRDTVRESAVALGACGLLLLPAFWILLGPSADLPGVDLATTPSGDVVSGREAGRAWAQEFSLWPWWVVGGGGSPESDISLGWTWILAGLAPLVATWRDRKHWLGIVLLGVVLSLGPSLRGPIGEEWSGSILPFAWLQDSVPLFYRMRWPYRAAAIVLPALAVIAALNLTELARELPRWRFLLAAAAILGIAVEIELFGESRISKTTTYEEPGEVYSVLDGPVLILPLQGDDDSVRTALWMQIWHKQPISYGIGGHIDGHRPAEWDEWTHSSELLTDLISFEHGPPSKIEVSPADVQDLLDRGFRYALVDSRHFRETHDAMMVYLYTQVMTPLFGDPIAEDQYTRIWRLAPIAESVVLESLPGSTP